MEAEKCLYDNIDSFVFCYITSYVSELYSHHKNEAFYIIIKDFDNLCINDTDELYKIFPRKDDDKKTCHSKPEIDINEATVEFLNKLLRYADKIYKKEDLRRICIDVFNALSFIKKDYSSLLYELLLSIYKYDNTMLLYPNFDNLIKYLIKSNGYENYVITRKDVNEIKKEVGFYKCTSLKKLCGLYNFMNNKSINSRINPYLNDYEITIYNISDKTIVFYGYFNDWETMIKKRYPKIIDLISESEKSEIKKIKIEKLNENSFVVIKAIN